MAILTDKGSAQLESEFLTLMEAKLEKALALMELRLVDRFASRAELAEIAKRLDKHEQDTESSMQAIVAWRNRTLGAATLIAFVMPVLATISWHLWG